MSEDDDYDLGPIPGVSDTSLHLPEIQEEGAMCEYCHGEVKHFPTPEMRDNFTSEEVSAVNTMFLEHVTKIWVT